MLLPRLEAAFHFHDGIALRGELHRGVGTQMTGLGIAVNDVHTIPAQAGHGVPVFLGKTYRPGDMALLEIFGRPHVYDMGVPLDRQFQSMPIFSCPMVAVLPIEHPLVKEGKGSISVNRLTGLNLLIASQESAPGYIERLNVLCAAANFTPTTTQPVEGTANVLGMVAAGYGVAILPEVAVTSFANTCQTRRLRAPVPPFHLKLLWLRNDKSPLLQNFLAVAKQWINEAGKDDAPNRARITLASGEPH